MQSLTEFYLIDQDQQSIKAKMNLEQVNFEIQREEIIIDKLKKNQQTINLLQKSQKLIKQQENYGWRDDFKQRTINSTQNNQRKNRKLFNNKNHQVRGTLKYKSCSKSQKKYSLDVNQINSRKCNITFNNIIPDGDMETIRELQVSKEISKKAKSQSLSRPLTATYYGPSHKILTLFEKQPQGASGSIEGVRIHSGLKELYQSRKQYPITFSSKQNFLKTSSLNIFSSTTKKNIQPTKKRQSLDKKSSIQKNIEVQKKETIRQQQCIQKQQIKSRRNSHLRTNSVPTQFSNQYQNKQKTLSNQQPFRKNMMLRQKKNCILKKKIKSQQNFIIQQHEIAQTYQSNENQLNPAKQYQQGKQNIGVNLEASTSIVEQDSLVDKVFRHSSQKSQKVIPKQPVVYSNTNLEGDFSQLVKMLKLESQQVLGGQLHSYLANLKNNFQFHNYRSRQLKQSSNLRTIKNFNKFNINSSTPKHQCRQITANNAVIKQQIMRNNTTLHYTSLSSSKHKSKDRGQFRKTHNSSFNWANNGNHSS